MNKVQHFTSITELAKDNEYEILLIDTNFFLGYDLVQGRYCIVFFKKKDTEYIIDEDIESYCLDDKEKAIIEYNRLLDKDIK